MHNVDSASFGMSLNLIHFNGKYRITRKYNRTKYLESKITSKLYLNDFYRTKKVKKLEEFIKHKCRKFYNKEDFIFWFGKHGGYSYCYNETLQFLTMTLQHDEIESYTAEEIIENLKKELIDYFELEPKDLKPITLRRIDYYCDFRYQNKYELLIIKYIIKIARDKLYTYRKEIRDITNAYAVNYISLKGNNTVQIEEILL